MQARANEELDCFGGLVSPLVFLLAPFLPSLPLGFSVPASGDETADCLLNLDHCGARNSDKKRSLPAQHLKKPASD
jgi:hypothetical protein